MSNRLPTHTAANLKAARTLATRTYGRTSLHLFGDGVRYSVVVRDRGTGIDLAIIHLAD